MEVRDHNLGLMRWRLVLGTVLLVWILLAGFIPQAQAEGGSKVTASISYIAGSDSFNTPCVMNRATGSSLWAKSYESSTKGQYGQAHTIQQTADGGYILAGHMWYRETRNQDIWVIKLDPEGEIEWQKTYGGPSDEEVHSIQQTTDGGYILAGSTWSFSVGASDAWVVKLGPNGNIEWQTTLGHAGGDKAAAVQEMSDGSYLIAGKYYGNAWLFKLDRNGILRWQRTYGEAGRAISVNDFQGTDDGGYILAGSSLKSTFDFWAMKLDANGRVQWSQVYSRGRDAKAYAVQQTTDGGFILAGETKTAGAYFDAWVVKLRPNGDIEWEKTFGGGEYDVFYDVLQTRDGGYLLVGETWSFGAGNIDVWMLKLTPEGRVQWQKTYGTPGGEWGESVLQTENGDYVVAGVDGGDMLVFRMNAQGDIPGCNLFARSTPEVRNSNVRRDRLSMGVGWASIRVWSTNATVATPAAVVRVRCIAATPTPTPTPTTGTVQGHVWADVNRNGERDAGEGGLAGLTVRLVPAQASQAQVREAVTNAQGFYRFTNVPPGRYTVSLIYPGGVYAVSDLTVEANVAANTVVDVDFALYPLSRRQFLPTVMQ